MAVSNPLTTTEYADFLKEWYQGTVVADLVYENRPWLGLVPKNENVRGKQVVKPVRYSDIVGRSATYSTAHTNQNSGSRDQWVMTHVDNYAKATIQNKAIELSMGDPAAFREALTDEVDSAFRAFGNDVHFELLAKYPNGARGQAASTYGTPAGGVTLGAGEARFFEVGMLITNADSGDYATANNSSETRTITAVDRINDYIYFGSDFTTLIVAGDTRFHAAGDCDNKATSLPTWLPGSAVTTSLHGVDRTLDPTRLAGVDGVSGTSYLNSLVLTGAYLYREGQTPDICLMNPVEVANLAEETESGRARYSKVDSTSGSLSFSSLEIMTGAGAVPIIADPGVVEDTYLMGRRSAVELFSAGGLPRMFKKDGSFYHREEDADTISFYLFGYYEQCLQAPVAWSYCTDIVA